MHRPIPLDPSDYRPGSRFLDADTYVFVDIETDGPCPGLHSMLAFGAVAFDGRRGRLGEFSVNLDALDGCTPDPQTAAWWGTQPEAWASIRSATLAPPVAMALFEDWLRALGEPAVLVSAPASFDFGFLHWYCYRFLDRRIPFLRFGMDLNSFVSGATGLSYQQAGRWNWPRPIAGDTAVGTHDPLDDARKHCESFIRVLRALGHCAAVDAPR